MARLSVEVVFETHSTTEDDEAGIATGWSPGPALGGGPGAGPGLGERRRDDGLSVLRECNHGELNGTPEPLHSVQRTPADGGLLAGSPASDRAIHSHGSVFGNDPLPLSGRGESATAQLGRAWAGALYVPALML